jgi:hypothetical protein
MGNLIHRLMRDLTWQEDECRQNGGGRQSASDDVYTPPLRRLPKQTIHKSVAAAATKSVY